MTSFAKKVKSTRHLYLSIRMVINAAEILENIVMTHQEILKMTKIIYIHVQ
jgi:hypothetical protein